MPVRPMLDNSSSWIGAGNKKLVTAAAITLGALLLVWLSLTVIPVGAEKRGLECPEQVRQADLDQDDRLETYLLKGLRLTVTEDGRVIWQSPADWRVAQFVLADSNNDGLVDLNMVVWKRGSFGAYRPFWFKGEDRAYCNHLYVFDLSRGQIKPVWMSSGLEAPIISLNIRDVDGDGSNELAVVEQPPGTADKDTAPAGKPACIRLTYWRWDVWGFTRVALPAGEPIKAREGDGG